MQSLHLIETLKSFDCSVGHNNGLTSKWRVSYHHLRRGYRESRTLLHCALITIFISNIYLYLLLRLAYEELKNDIKIKAIIRINIPLINNIYDEGCDELMFIIMAT